MNRIIIALFISVPLLSGCSSHGQEVYATDKGAVNGYDVVAYFTESKPVEGHMSNSLTWNGATWRFASMENLEKFKAEPERFAPQYGGYCAYGTADGHKAPTSPDAWAIVNDKLYLNYNKQVQAKWFEKQSELIEQADENWPKVKME